MKTREELQQEVDTLKFKIKQLENLDENQMSLFDLFNETETIQQPFVAEPIVQGHCQNEEIFVTTHKKKKAKRFEKLCDLPAETMEYTLEDEEGICEFCGEILT